MEGWVVDAWKWFWGDSASVRLFVIGCFIAFILDGHFRGGDKPLWLMLFLAFGIGWNLAIVLYRETEKK